MEINLNEYKPSMPLSLPFTVLIGRALYLVVRNNFDAPVAEYVCIFLHNGVIDYELRGETLGELFNKFHRITKNWRIVKTEINVLQFGGKPCGIQYDYLYPEKSFRSE